MLIIFCEAHGGLFISIVIVVVNGTILLCDGYGNFTGLSFLYKFWIASLDSLLVFFANRKKNCLWGRRGAIGTFDIRKQ